MATTTIASSTPSAPQAHPIATTEPSSLVTTAAAQASIPPARTVDATLLSILLAEVPPTLRHSARVASQRVEEHMAHLREAGFALPSSSADEQSSEQEQLYARLNTLGAHVGANYAERLCASRPPFGSVLEVLKFLCKDLWISLWERQVDNLRTNHRGVYALQVNSFLPLQYLGTCSPTQFGRAARPHLSHAAGIVRGALSRLGVPATVSVDILPLSSPPTEPAPLGQNKFIPPILFNVKTFPVSAVPPLGGGGVVRKSSSSGSGRPSVGSAA